MIPNNLGNCLMTGSTGFVGKRLAELLAKSGNNLSVISRRVRGKYPGVSCNFIEDEIPRDIFSDIDTVFHLAGLAHDTKGRYQKSLYEKINIDTTKQLAKIAHEQGVKRFIFLSSVKASEVSPINSTKAGLYGITKRKAELELIKLSTESDMKIGIVRSCLVYGPNMKGNLLAMLRAVNSGWFPKITKADNKKSLIHVDDLAKALIFIANNYLGSDPLTVTDGKTYSLKDIYNIFYQKKHESKFDLRLSESLLKLAYFFPVLNTKLEKLYGDDLHNPEEIFNLGFLPEFTLEDFNEKGF